MSHKYFRFILLFLSLLNIFFLSATIAYQVTKSGEMTTLPNLAGMSLEEARMELTKQKLFVVQSGVQLHDRYEQGKIISHDPPPETKVKLNEVVKVVISAGKKKVIVPNFRGRTLQAILSTLQEASLRKGRVSHVHTPKYAAGKIISQYPAPDEEVGINTRINLLVSQGDHEQKFLMPDLLGRRLSSVSSRLIALGFRVGDVRRSYYPGLESGIIINQIPEQGKQILKRNRIILEVSK